MNKFNGDPAGKSEKLIDLGGVMLHSLSFVVSFQYYNQVHAMLYESKFNVFNLRLVWNFKVKLNSCPMKGVFHFFGGKSKYSGIKSKSLANS